MVAIKRDVEIYGDLSSSVVEPEGYLYFSMFYYFIINYILLMFSYLNERIIL